MAVRFGYYGDNSGYEDYWWIITASCDCIGESHKEKHKLKALDFHLKV